MISKRILFVFAAALGLAAFGCAGPSEADQQPTAADEVQLGQEVFKELEAKGEIVKSSPLYDDLSPITDAIARSAQPQYDRPFKFYLVHQKQPNAFATPGGNVYVTDALLYFVKNKDELAGTLCHEVSHTIHHDTMKLMEEEAKIRRREIAAAVLLGPTRAHLLAIALIGKLNSLGYSRDAEERADMTGADVCARTAYNPWGLVWLFQDFTDADIGQAPELLSDHPNNQHRIDTLKLHFRQNPAAFAKFNPDPKSSPKFTVPKDAPESFLP